VSRIGGDSARAGSDVVRPGRTVVGRVPSCH